MKMTILSGLGIGLSLVFGCLLIALVAEFYYLLWWKNRVVNTESEEQDGKGFFFLLRRRRPSSAGHGGDTKETDGNGGEIEEEDPELGSGKDSLVKAFGEEGIESELKRLHNLAGPPRFLFTIKEETREDLETESVKSRTRSLSDLVMTSSPMNSSPSLLGSFNHHGFNPLFESSGTELAGLGSSPEPKFKFLRDAEEKLRLKEAKRVSENGGLVPSSEDCEAKGESFVTIIVSKNNKNRGLDA